MRPAVVVLDTNVLVSGLINSFGAPGRVVDLVLSRDLVVAYDDRILAEWRDVLRREKFGFAPESVAAFLNFAELEGQRVTARPLTARLPDPNDAPFLEVASAAGAPLVTGNVKHYPAAVRGGVEVMTPRDFVDHWSADQAALKEFEEQHASRRLKLFLSLGSGILFAAGFTLGVFIQWLWSELERGS